MVYKNIMKFKTDILKEDDRLFEENIIMGELNKALNNNKDMLNGNDFSKYKTALTDQGNRIRENINVAKNIWTNLTNTQRKKIWTMLQILLKLSEKYAERELI